MSCWPFQFILTHVWHAVIVPSSLNCVLVYFFERVALSYSSFLLIRWFPLPGTDSSVWLIFHSLKCFSKKFIFIFLVFVMTPYHRLSFRVHHLCILYEFMTFLSLDEQIFHVYSYITCIVLSTGGYEYPTLPLSLTSLDSNEEKPTGEAWSLFFLFFLFFFAVFPSRLWTLQGRWPKWNFKQINIKLQKFFWG